MNTKITIPLEYYVGMRSQGDSIPLAFLTPNGTDKASLNRIQTVNSWAKGRDALDPTIIENKALHGFKLTSDIRRSGRFGSGDKWCIEDPRGFELEISSTNLAYLLQNCIIENGIIIDPCIWARQSGNNVLLSTLSYEYINAVQYTQIKSTAESIKNVHKGNKIVLQNGTVGTYLGKYHLLSKPYKTNKMVSLQPAASHVLHVDGYSKTLWISTNVKISSIKDKTVIDNVVAEQRVNEILQSKDSVVFNHSPPLIAVANKPISWTTNLIEVDNVYKALNKKSNKTVIVKLKNDIYGVVNFYRDVKTTYSCDVIDITQIANEEIRYKTKKVSSLNRFVGTWETDEIIIENFQDDDVDKVYHIEIYSKTKLGNVIKRII